MDVETEKAMRKRQGDYLDSLGNRTCMLFCWAVITTRTVFKRHS